MRGSSEPIPAAPAAALEEQARIFEALAGLCEEHRAALAANDAERLAGLTERAETLAARFRLLQSAAGPLPPAGGERSEAIDRLTEAAARAAVAVSGCADLLARSSAATAALRRVIDGAIGPGYQASGEPAAPTRAGFVEKRA